MLKKKLLRNASHDSNISDPKSFFPIPTDRRTKREDTLHPKHLPNFKRNQGRRSTCFNKKRPKYVKIKISHIKLGCFDIIIRIAFYHGVTAPPPPTPVGQGLLTIAETYDHTQGKPQSVGLLWTSDHLDAEKSF